MINRGLGPLVRCHLNATSYSLASSPFKYDYCKKPKNFSLSKCVEFLHYKNRVKKPSGGWFI